MADVKSLLKVLDILEFIGSSPTDPSLAHIAGSLGLNRTTAYRLLQTLKARGYVTRDETTGGYQIGLNVLPLTAKLLDNNQLWVESVPYLQELARKSDERVNLGILHEDEVLYLGGIEKPSFPLVFSRFWKRAPCHCCSIGKILLAHKPEEEVDRLIARKGLTRLTPDTITDPRRFKKHLAQVRAQGYAIDNAEHIPGGYCISALIRDSRGDGIAGISISSGDLAKIKEQLGNLRETAEIISIRMGFTVRWDHGTQAAPGSNK